MNTWNSTEDCLPEVGQEVLGFYQIDDFDYFVVCRIESITTEITKGNKRVIVDWLDGNNDEVIPAFWMPLPPKP